MIGEKYYLMNGKVLMKKVDLSSSELRVEFVGDGEISLVRSLSIVPDDFLLEQVKLSIHSQAVANFNEKGLSVVSSCKEGNTQEFLRAKGSQFPDMYSWITISDKDIVGEIEHGLRDNSGNPIGKYFSH